MSSPLEQLHDTDGEVLIAQWQPTISPVRPAGTRRYSRSSDSKGAVAHGVWLEDEGGVGGLRGRGKGDVRAWEYRRNRGNPRLVKRLGERGETADCADHSIGARGASTP